MKLYKVSFRPRAEADLWEIHEYVSGEAGAATAGSFIDRIEAACLALSRFPRRGRNRDDLRPGLRTVSLDRRVLIAFSVVASEVIIARVFYGGRDFESGNTTGLE